MEKDKNVNTQTLPDPSPTMSPVETGITLDQLIFDGFATHWDIARNSARVSSAVYKIIATIDDTIQRDVEVYINVLREQSLVSLAKQNLLFHQTIMRMIELRTKNGISRRADLFQAKGRLALAQSNVLAELSNIQDAKANFYRVVGVNPENLVMPSHPASRYLPASMTEAIKLGFKNNPVIKSADADIQAAIAQHRTSYSTNYPHLDLELNASRDRNTGGVRGPTFQEYAKVRLSYNLYNGGADLSKQRETAFQEQEAKDIKYRAIRQMIEATKLTWDSLVTARQQLSFLKAHVEETEATVRAYAQEYRIGQRTLLDLLDSQNELFSAKRAYIQGKYVLLESEYRILRDMGLSIAAFKISPSMIL